MNMSDIGFVSRVLLFFLEHIHPVTMFDRFLTTLL